MILITGCGRSATKYCNVALNRIGLEVGHEKKGKDGTVDWHLPYDDVSAYDVILHQVRDPLKVIASCHTIMGSSWNFICSKEPRVIRAESVLLRSMKYWLYWNEQAEKIASHTYQIEKFDTKQIASLLGVALLDQQKESVDKIPEDYHSRKKRMPNAYPEIGYSDLLKADEKVGMQIQEQAKRYGY